MTHFGVHNSVIHYKGLAFPFELSVQVLLSLDMIQSIYLQLIKLLLSYIPLYCIFLKQRPLWVPIQMQMTLTLTVKTTYRENINARINTQNPESFSHTQQHKKGHPGPLIKITDQET